MGSGTATGQASPFRNTLPSPMLWSEQLRRWQERICRDDRILDGQSACMPQPSAVPQKQGGSYLLISGPGGQHQRGRFLGVIVTSVSQSHVLCVGSLEEIMAPSVDRFKEAAIDPFLGQIK